LSVSVRCRPSQPLLPGTQRTRSVWSAATLLSGLGQYGVDAGLIFCQAGTLGRVGLRLAPGLVSLMSIDPGPRGAVLDWIKASGLLLVTVLGILLYIVFSVPATIFYGRLGTTPGEVGITYSSLLSGSTFGILVILAVLTLTLVGVSFPIAFITFYIRSVDFAPQYTMRRPFTDKTDWQLTDEEYDQRIASLREAFAATFPELWDIRKPNIDEVESHIRRLRELDMLGVRTAEQQAELDARADWRPQNPPSSFSTILIVTKHWMKRRGKILFVVFPLLIAVIVLPGTAYVQAQEIINGKPFTGSQLNFFDYRADLVSVTPASETVRPDIKPLIGKRLFFLGQNSQDIIFYSPVTKATIRVPSVAAVVTSIP
jgi:hypothetical protein